MAVFENVNENELNTDEEKQINEVNLQYKDIVFGSKEEKEKYLKGVRTKKAIIFVSVCVLLLITLFAVYRLFIYPRFFVCVKKPNIYLYVDKQTDVSVKLKMNGKIVKSIPEYNKGWDVSVMPGGKIDGKYDFLFYEARVLKTMTLDKGFVIHQKDFNTYMTDFLVRKIGLNEKETSDFIEYWSKAIDWGKGDYIAYYISRADIDRLIQLEITPKPEIVERVFFYFVPCSKVKVLPIEPQIVKIERKGFTVVEWGGFID